MAHPSPLTHLHTAAEAMTIAYGPASPTASTPAGSTDETASSASSAPSTPAASPTTPTVSTVSPIDVVATYGELMLEYSALRRHAVLVDMPHRAVIELKGADRIGFLNRMVTQELKGFEAGHTRRAFWLNRKGRIDSDMLLIELGDRLLIEVDVFSVSRTIAGLSAYVITEDCVFRDLTQSSHRFSLHGPTVAALLDALDPALAAPKFTPGQARVGTLATHQVIVYREDWCGVPGYELIVPAAAAEAIYQLLVQDGHDPHHGAGALRISGQGTLGSRVRLRPAGWMALNIARLESGTPLYHIDFGSDSLPAESGVLDSRVSFTKGCYLGQEIVARMHARGHPKQKLMAFSLDATGFDQPLPSAGSSIKDSTGIVIGTVTSGTYSPMRGSQRIGLGMVKYQQATDNTAVMVDAEGMPCAGRLHNSMTTLSH
ncbi:MAG: hypothetical protein KGS45_04860 [Planctomycetes bacterium]|nr:hypothetical protein [Planctomycetota bacterium]